MIALSPNSNLKHLKKKEHGDVEQHINEQGHEIMRRLLQGHLNRLAANESVVPVVTADTDKELNHVRNKNEAKSHEPVWWSIGY